jgi:leucyl-tRNA synthetase
MARYDFLTSEPKWQRIWREQGLYEPEASTDKPKFYVLDMFPYPSGAGLHVGHPLGYIATDIIARFKKLKGYNVLHPMGFDAFGLPAENYAIQTGKRPQDTTEENIKRYNEQLEMLGMAYAKSAEFRTSDPSYYKWTQWIFLQFFDSWYNLETNCAEPISKLVERFAQTGNKEVKAASDANVESFSASEWAAYDEAKKREILLGYRLAYQAEVMVNWCEALGSVLANDEVVNGVSVRGSHPVTRKPMRQWMLRVTAYAQRLLDDLESLEWSEALKDMQRNWIGRSEGARVHFRIDGHQEPLEVFTTRPDTLFGVSFMVLNPEHPLIATITIPSQKQAVEAYQLEVAAKSERERLAQEKPKSGVFTGAYALHPFNGEKLPIYVADYVLAGYGSGAIMAVPGHDSRDHGFAKLFNLPILEVVAGSEDVQSEAFESKTGTLVNSDFMDGLAVPEAIKACLDKLEALGIGERKVNFRIRDVVFSRQRYWGEPFPIVYDADGPKAVSADTLPVVLPEIDNFQPTGTGESPLARAADWVNLPDGTRRETDTMPGSAGSSWYFLRYADPLNDLLFADPSKLKYWLPVDLYVGGTEHAVGHLIYARFWTKLLYDLGHVPVQEPFARLVNQGMIQGRTSFVYKLKHENTFVSKGQLKDGEETLPLRVDVSFVENDKLDLAKFRAWRPEYANTEFRLEPDGSYICGYEVEKMSKSFYNVVTPDDICAQYGADVFRLYEMFLGPLEQHKPFSTQGISGVQGFLNKAAALLWDADGQLIVTDEAATDDELRLVHRLVRKVEEDVERLSFNTTVPAFMIFVNGITGLKTHKRSVIEPFLQVLAPYAPHFAEEAWHALGHSESIFRSTWPTVDEQYLLDDEIVYPVQENGKHRFNLTFPAGLDKADLEARALGSPEVQKLLAGRPLKRLIVVPGKIINVVV